MSYDSWGRNVDAERRARPVSELTTAMMTRGGSWLPYGNGRSYGDSCHNDAGVLIDSRRANRIISFDPQSGELTCEAGVLLSEILAFALPRGFFLPVTPGTRFVTIGGAIANDVHGKNHHVRGTFGMHVSRFNLLRSDRGMLECAPNLHGDLFAATIGGMGLTGLITEATIRLMRVDSPDVRQRTLRFDNIDTYFEHCADFDDRHEYAVAWIDQLAKGKDFGRGLLFGGDHDEAGKTKYTVSPNPRWSIPFTPPVSMLNQMTLKAFNALYFKKEQPGQTLRVVPWQSYFYPLDSIGHWNRLYGPRGLFQHQSVYPEASGYETTVRLLKCTQEHEHASFLTVLKRFGTLRSPGLLSFPRPGFTLTLDFANQGERTLRLLDALDEVVLAAGGAVNPYKDARMSQATFNAGFPEWRNFERWRDPAMMSDFWKRAVMQQDNSRNTMALTL